MTYEQTVWQNCLAHPRPICHCQCRPPVLPPCFETETGEHRRGQEARTRRWRPNYSILPYCLKELLPSTPNSSRKAANFAATELQLKAVNARLPHGVLPHRTYLRMPDTIQRVCSQVNTNPTRLILFHTTQCTDYLQYSTTLWLASYYTCS